MIIQDLYDRDDIVLITDSQECEIIKHDGDYSEIYGFYGTIPTLYKILYKVK